MPKVLMVTPYWPPLNKVGVWRVLRAARYLPDHGWTPVICTPRPEQVYKNPPLYDDSFHIPSVEVIQPHTLIPSMVSARALAKPRQWIDQLDQKPSSSHSLLRKGLTRLTQFLDQGSFRAIAEILPPDQFVEWGWQVARQLKRRRDLDDVDVIWTTGGPFGFFVAGVLIAQALNKPLVLDYRDPWTTHRQPRTWWIAPPQSVFRSIESWALSKASSVGYIHREALDANRAAFGQPEGALWSVIPNSFDPIDLGDLPPRFLSEECGAPALVYAGNFYEARSALPIIQGLIDLDQSPDGDLYPLTLHVFGQIDPPALTLLRDQPLPAHRLKCYARHSAAEIGSIMKGAEGLLLMIGNLHGHRSALSGKLWDYLAAGVPIMGVGPEGAAAQSFILEHQLGAWAHTDDRDGILRLLKAFSQGEVSMEPPEKLTMFHARHMSASMATLLQHAFDHDLRSSVHIHRSNMG